jgi:hypothetical protein
MTRSKDLTEGFRWRIVGMFLLLTLIQGGIQLVGPVFSLVFPPAEQVPAPGVIRQVINPTNYVIYVLILAVLEVVAESYAVVCWTLFYFDLRIRKEGFDLELMAQRQRTGPVSAAEIQVEVVDDEPPDTFKPWSDNQYRPLP